MCKSSSTPMRHLPSGENRSGLARATACDITACSMSRSLACISARSRLRVVPYATIRPNKWPRSSASSMARRSSAVSSRVLRTSPSTFVDHYMPPGLRHDRAHHRGGRALASARPDQVARPTSHSRPEATSWLPTRTWLLVALPLTRQRASWRTLHRGSAEGAGRSSHAGDASAPP
jgi:hypothetical protein